MSARLAPRNRGMVVPVSETWVIDDGTATPLSPTAAAEVLLTRVARGRLETWLTSSAGRSLGFVTNTERAMVLLPDGDADPGEHAVDPGARGSSGGFVLANGQHDAYADADTVPIDEAVAVVTHLLRHGSWPPATRWVSDRD